MALTPRVHGGAEVRWDFSTNVNAAGPCPQAVTAVANADATHYPDASYSALRTRLANFHRVDVDRILLAGSASAFIQRVTAVSQRLAPGPVEVPPLAYGDYAVAARACGRTVVPPDAFPSTATLRWCCDPGSPLGQDAEPPRDLDQHPTVLDAAYAPLRLGGRTSWSADALDAAFQLFSPNKALGMPGVRGAYAIAPSNALRSWRDALDNAAPSWPLGAHAVALLACWTEPATQAWLAESLVTLRTWTATLRAGLDRLDLQPASSVTPFLCARRPVRAEAGTLREHGLAVRDTASFGLPGWMRVSAQPPDATDALLTFLERLDR